MLSEIDIQDWQQLPVQPLYNVPRKTYIKLPWMADDDKNNVIYFDHLDGAYSFCLTLANEIVHISASAQVIPLQKKSVDAE